MTEFDTVLYVWSHGKEPRGRGSWAFGFGEKDPKEPWFAPVGTYTEAKRAAKAAARKRGFRGVVFVLP